MASQDYKLYTEGIKEGDLSTRIMGVHKANDYLREYALSKNPRQGPLVTLSQLSFDEKRALLSEISKCAPRQKPNYRACDCRVFTYEEGKCPKKYYLDNNNYVEYCIPFNIDDDKIHIEDQYIHVKSSAPEISPTFDISTIPNYNPENVRFRYTAKPGIRLFENMDFQVVSRTVESITQIQMLHFDKEMVPENMYALWNYLIGHDIGSETEVVLPDTAAINVQIMKYGYQTPKPEQPGLDFFVPLLFDHNEEALNTGLLRNRSTFISGKLQKSSLMVIAEYYDGTADPIPIPCSPLTIELSIVNNYVRFGDNINALRLNYKLSRLISLTEVDTYKIKDLDEMIKIRGHGVLEALSVSIRPLNYKNDFDLWQYFEEVEQICTQVPILINDPFGNPGQAAVSPVKSYQPVRNFTKLGLKWGEIELKSFVDSEIYRVIQKYRLSKNTKLRLTKPNGFHLLLFNDLWLTRQFSLVYNISSVYEPYLMIEFVDRLVDKINSTLIEEYEIVVIRHHINTFSSYGSTMGINYQQ